MKNVLLFITLTSLIVTGCAFFQKNQQPVSESLFEDTCVSITNEDERALCYYPLVNNTENPDVKICDKLKDPLYKDACYINVAAFKPDTTLCEKVSVEMKDRCYLEIVKGPNPPEDETFCGKITLEDWKRHCIGVIRGNNRYINAIQNITAQAVEQKNPTLCKQIISSSEPATTSAIDNRTPENYDHDDCIIKVATSTGNASICGKEKFLIYSGAWSCYVSLALEQKDKNLCLKISDSTWQEDCIKMVEK